MGSATYQQPQVYTPPPPPPPDPLMELAAAARQPTVYIHNHAPHRSTAGSAFTAGMFATFGVIAALFTFCLVSGFFSGFVRGCNAEMNKPRPTPERPYVPAD
jgi:hypothetical protein